MKKLILLVLAGILIVTVSAQEKAVTTKITTVYDEFKPAVITLKNGSVIRHKQANVFMKNGSLLYKHGKTNMQANMNQIKTVDFGDRHYCCIDTLLAYVVDSVAGNKLLCATLIDMESYMAQLLNNRQITNLEIKSQINVTSLDMSDDEEQQYPLVNYFFYELDGKIIKVHERIINNIISKEKRRKFKTVIMMPEFSWNDKECLIELLKAIS